MIYLCVFKRQMNVNLWDYIFTLPSWYFSITVKIQTHKHPHAPLETSMEIDVNVPSFTLLLIVPLKWSYMNTGFSLLYCYL